MKQGLKLPLVLLHLQCCGIRAGDLYTAYLFNILKILRKDGYPLYLLALLHETFH